MSSKQKKPTKRRSTADPTMPLSAINLSPYVETWLDCARLVKQTFYPQVCVRKPTELGLPIARINMTTSIDKVPGIGPATAVLLVIMVSTTRMISPGNGRHLAAIKGFSTIRAGRW